MGMGKSRITSARRMLALIASTGMVMAACSSDSKSSPASTAATTAATTSLSTSGTTAASSATSESTVSSASTPVETVQLTSGEGLDSGLGSRATNRRVVFVTDNPPSDPFWGTIQQGAQDAAQLFNIDLDYQFTPEGADIVAYNDLIGTAVASQPAAMAVVVRDPDVLTENICAAHDAGIPVMSYNVTQGGAVGDCLEGFIGQDFAAAGYLIGQRMVKEAELGKGDLVLLPVEQPDASYAIERGSGVKKALDEVGATYEMIQAGAKGDAEALENMTQWLIGHPDVKAIIPLGGTPHRNAIQALSDAGLSPDNVIVGGFDISQPVVEGITDGTIRAAVTQEPYIQGFQTVAELAMLLDFGIQPFSINTGAGIVDKSNVAVVAELAGTIR